MTTIAAPKFNDGDLVHHVGKFPVFRKATIHSEPTEKVSAYGIKQHRYTIKRGSKVIHDVASSQLSATNTADGHTYTSIAIDTSTPPAAVGDTVYVVKYKQSKQPRTIKRPPVYMTGDGAGWQYLLDNDKIVPESALQKRAVEAEERTIEGDMGGGATPKGEDDFRPLNASDYKPRHNKQETLKQNEAGGWDAFDRSGSFIGTVGDKPTTQNVWGQYE